MMATRGHAINSTPLKHSTRSPLHIGAIAMSGVKTLSGVNQIVLANHIHINHKKKTKKNTNEYTHASTHSVNYGRHEMYSQQRRSSEVVSTDIVPQ